jgi:hypothetical protein
MERVRRIVNPARLRTARAVKAGRFAGALIAAGWAVTLVLGHGNWDQVIAASAFWLVAVLFLLSAWELVLLLTGAPTLGVLPRSKWLARIETWLVPGGLVAGLLFGHYLWS